MIPFLRPCRAAAPRMTRGRPPVPGPCGRRAAAGSRSRGRPVQGMAHPPCGDGFPLPRASRSGRGVVRRAAMASRSRGRPARGAAHPPCGDGLPLPRASPAITRRLTSGGMASRSRGRPVHGRVGRASVPWLPAPAGVPLRAWRRPPCGHALPRVRPPAASPVRPCAGAVLRPPHFHHSIWKANDKPAPPNVMISLRFPAAGAEKKRASPPARTFLLFTSPHVHAVPCIAIASRLAFTIL